jgi:hypothetical protein
MVVKQDSNVGYDIVPRRKNRYPRENAEFLNLPKVIADFLLDEKTKIRFEKNTRFFLQGSCFAEKLFLELKKRSYQCFYNEFLEYLNSPLANMQYLGGLLQNPADPIFQEIKKSDVYILTIGVAPCWFKKTTGEFVLQPNANDLSAYYQRTISVEESKQALLFIFSAIRGINPRIKIVLTLSPVPLGRSFDFESAIIADCVSKSVLRASMHEALAACHDPKPTYFPSFEIVRWVGGHAGNAFGDDGLPRHVSQQYVKEIISSFLSSNEANSA